LRKGGRLGQETGENIMRMQGLVPGGIVLVTFLAGFLAQVCIADSDKNYQARQIIERKDDGDGIIKILLCYDMEGVSGQNILTSIDFPRPEYFAARELLTADVDAVIDGLFAGGADSVFVVDIHGSFNPEPDIRLDKMDSRAHMLFKKKKFHPYVDLLNENNYDGIVTVAMHSKTGGGGFADHTVNVGCDWILNGMSLTESEIIAYSWGRIGIPLIFVSGDDKLAQQISWMNWIEYVTVKEAAGIDSVVLYPVVKVHDELREAARRSIVNLDDMKVVRLVEPITATLRVIPPADLSILEGVPGINYRDQSVTFQAANFQEAYDGMRGLMNVAQSGLYNIAASVLLNQGEESFVKFKDAVFEIWKNQASDTGQVAEPTAKATPEKEHLYFGSQ
jgi:D-amino peptidase